MRKAQAAPAGILALQGGEDVNRLRCTAALLLACAAFGAVAQTAYRCGPGGRVYQSAPCQGGREIDISDPRTDEQRRSAQEAVAADRRLASQLERDQRAREAAQRAAMPRVVVVAATQPAASHAVYGHARRHGRGVRYFADGAPMPPVYRVPGPGRQHK